MIQQKPTAKQLDKICKQSGGAKALEVIVKNMGELIKLGLSKDEIVKIASNNGGAQALRVVKTAIGKMEKQGKEARRREPLRSDCH